MDSNWSQERKSIQRMNSAMFPGNPAVPAVRVVSNSLYLLLHLMPTSPTGGRTELAKSWRSRSRKMSGLGHEAENIANPTHTKRRVFKVVVVEIDADVCGGMG